MGKIIKGVITYTCILLAIFAIIAMLLFGIMFVTSGSEKPFKLFGYGAVYAKGQTQNSQVINLEGASIKDKVKLEINGGGYGVEIVQTTDTTKNFVLNRRDDIFGITSSTLKTTNEYEIKDIFSVEDVFLYKLVRITLPKLEGVVFYGNSNIKILVPRDMEFIYDFDIATENGDIIINGKTLIVEKRISIDELRVETKNGNLNVSNINSNIKLEKSNPEISRLGKIVLKTNKGKFNFNDIKKLYVGMDENLTAENSITISSSYGDFVFDYVNAPMNILGKNIKIVAGVVDTDKRGFKFNSPNGFFEIAEIISTGNDAIIEIITEKINVNIGKVNGVAKIKSTYGDIKIKETMEVVDLETTNGNIVVDTAWNSITAKSQMGNIKINEYKTSATITNDRGEITAAFSGVEDIKNKTSVISKKGGVILTGIVNEIDIKLSSAPMYLEFAKMVQNLSITHNIEIGSGNANIKITAIEAFRFTKNGNVTGKVVAFDFGEVQQNGIVSVFEANLNNNKGCLLDIKTESGTVTMGLAG